MLQIKIINLLCHLLQFSAQFLFLYTIQTVVQPAGLDYSFDQTRHIVYCPRSRLASWLTRSSAAWLGLFTQLYFTTKCDSKKNTKKTELN